MSHSYDDAVQLVQAYGRAVMSGDVAAKVDAGTALINALTGDHIAAQWDQRVLDAAEGFRVWVTEVQPDLHLAEAGVYLAAKNRAEARS